MTRRVLTARERAQMLRPWREVTAAGRPALEWDDSRRTDQSASLGDGTRLTIRYDPFEQGDSKWKLRHHTPAEPRGTVLQTHVDPEPLKGYALEWMGEG